MKRSEVLFGILKIPLDAFCVLAALLLAYRLREANIDLIPRVQLLEPSQSLPPFSYYLRSFAGWSAFAYVVIAAFFRLYALRVTLGAWHEAGRIVLTSLVWLSSIVAWYFLVEKQLFFSRMLLFHAVFFSTLFVLLVRAALLLLQRSLLLRGFGVRMILSVGSRALPSALLETLARDPRYRYEGHVASIDDLRGTQNVDLVLHTDAHNTDGDTVRLIEYCRSRHIGYAFLPAVFADVPHQLFVQRFGLVPILRFQPTPLDGWGRVAKRLFDFFLSLFLLIVLSPILLLLALLVVLTSGLPILYVSRRIGQHARRTIPVLKFRTMCRDADAMKEDLHHMSHRTDGPLFKVKNDPRVTALGRVLRRWTLDELPQLLNVLIGQMSLVGPRPHLPDEVARYTDEQRRVFAVKPGMTGLAQVSGRSDLSFEREMAYDMQYVEEWSPLLDLWILWRTGIVVVFGRGAD